MTTGPNFDEVLRVIDSLQMMAKHRVATPANWKQGEDVIIAGSVSDDEAKTIWPQGFKRPRPYIRIVPQPSGSRAPPSAVVAARARRSSDRMIGHVRYWHKADMTDLAGGMSAFGGRADRTRPRASSGFHSHPREIFVEFFEFELPAGFGL